MSELEPMTREEHFLAKAGGQDVEIPTPMTREEIFLNGIIEHIEELPTPTQEQVSIAVSAYLDEHGIGDELFIASEDIPEVLEG